MAYLIRECDICHRQCPQAREVDLGWDTRYLCRLCAAISRLHQVCRQLPRVTGLAHSLIIMIEGLSDVVLSACTYGHDFDLFISQRRVAATDERDESDDDLGHGAQVLPHLPAGRWGAPWPQQGHAEEP